MKKKQKLGILLLLTLVFNLLLPVVSQANELLQGVSSFQYTADGDRGGAFPLNNTKVFKNVEENENVKNFDYSDVGYQDFPNTKYIVPNVSAFDGGYHTYIDANGMEIYTKKTVKPTDDPTKFNIELDVISGKRVEKSKIDIAFVIDKSGSMQGTRWNSLKQSVSFFADNFPNSEFDTQFAIASFASNQVGWNTHRPYFELSRNNDGNFFTSNPSNVKSNRLLTDDPSGGTPTFLGVEAGVELLKDNRYGSRDDAYKFLIFITDGSPTWDGNHIYQRNRTQYTGIQNLTPSGLQYSIDSKYYNGNGSADIADYNALIGFIENRYSQIPNTTKFSIGIGNAFGSSYNNQQLMRALGPGEKGTHYVSNNVAQDLKAALDSIQSSIISSASSVSEGTIIDPMSDYVDIDAESLETYQLTLSQSGLNVLPTTDGNVADYAKNAVPNISENQLTVNNLSLNGDYEKSQGYRINYQVTLKEAYRDGSFYPANKKTYLVDKNHPDGIEFAVPSVKNKEVKDIKVTKVWKGTNQNHPTIKLSLMVGDKQIGDSVELHKGQTEYTFTELPVYDESGELIEYEVREDKVPGYEEGVVTKEKDGSFVITNYPKGDFEAIKSVDKDILKPDEEFTYTISVTNSVTDSTLKNLLVEDIIPDTLEVVSNAFLNGQDLGVISANQLNVTIPELKGKEVANITFKVKVKNTTPVGEIINKAKITNPEDPDKPKEPEVPVTVIRETDIHLLKTSMDGTTILPNATFLIQNLADKSETEATTDNNGKIIFSKITPGDYLIKEKKAPDGFKVMRDPIKITIDKFGVVSVTESNESFVSSNTAENKFEIKVKNEERGILPLTGGNGHIEYLIPAAILLSSSLLLSIYYLFRRRKGWN